MNQQPTPGMFHSFGDLAVFAVCVVGLALMGFALASWVTGGVQ